MREVKLGKILENAARIAGRQVGDFAVPESWKALAGLTIEDGIRRIAAEKLPMMQRIEFRRYRPTWDKDVEYAEGNEVWFGNDYWRCDESGAKGEAPDVSAAWRKLEMSEVSAFVGWDQPWENTVIDRGGVDTARFAYAADPKYHPDAAPIANVRMTEFGLVIPAPAPKGVFCRFVPLMPKIGFEEFRSDRDYEAGEAVYVTAKREVYQAHTDVKAGGPSPDANPEAWDAVRVPEIFEGYLTKLVAVDFLTEDQGKYQTKASADHEFEEICDRYHEGNGETRIRRGRFC